MAEIPTLSSTLQLPSDTHRGIDAAVQHALAFAPAMTDILVHEGHPLRVRSARGTLALHQWFAAVPPFIVTREHIVHYLADAQAEASDSPGRPLTAQQHWDTRILPHLAHQHALTFRLAGSNDHALRCSLFTHASGELALTMRVVPTEIAPLANLSLPRSLIAALTQSNSGLVIVTGPTGSGKSETAMSVLDWHNTHHAGHILTLEDPVEKRLLSRKSIVTQREIGHDVSCMADGLREALRMSTDVLFASEIRDADTAAQAIRAGESGALMIATLQGRSATGALRQLLGHADTGPLAPVLAGNLIAVVRQALVPARDGGRYLMAADVLFNTGPVTHALERGDWATVDATLRGDRIAPEHGIGMNDRLVDLVRRGEIEAAEALRATSDIPSLKKRLEAIVPASCRR